MEIEMGMEMDMESLRKLKHREVERLRHHHFQKLIAQVDKCVPNIKINPKYNTQTAILARARDFIQFLIDEYNRISAIIEVYSSSQSTNASSQGKLVIDEEPEQITSHCDLQEEFDWDCNFSQSEPKYQPPPSFLPLDSNYELSPEPTVSSQWSDYSPTDPPLHFYPNFPSPPSQSSSSFSQPVPSSQDIKHEFKHCSTCCCFSSLNYAYDRSHNRSFTPRDRLLTETIQDPPYSEHKISPWI